MVLEQQFQALDPNNDDAVDDAIYQHDAEDDDVEIVEDEVYNNSAPEKYFLQELYKTIYYQTMVTTVKRVAQGQSWSILSD